MRRRLFSFGSHRKAIRCGSDVDRRNGKRGNGFFAVTLKEREAGRHFISIHRMSDAAPANERARTIELEIQGSVEAMHQIARLREGALSYVPCMIRSLGDC